VFLVALGAATSADADLVAAERPPMQCTRLSCVDPVTGDYTHSFCDAAGCRRYGGVVGEHLPRRKLLSAQASQRPALVFTGEPGADRSHGHRHEANGERKTEEG